MIALWLTIMLPFALGSDPECRLTREIESTRLIGNTLILLCKAGDGYHPPGPIVWLKESKSFLPKWKGGNWDGLI